MILMRRYMRPSSQKATRKKETCNNKVKEGTIHGLELESEVAVVDMMIVVMVWNRRANPPCQSGSVLRTVGVRMELTGPANLSFVAVADEFELPKVRIHT